MRSRIAGAAALAGALALLAPAVAHGALTADTVTMANTAPRVRVVVHFTGGQLTGLERQTDAIDPSPLDGRAIVRVNGTGITSTVGGPVTKAGVTTRVIRRTGSILVRATSAANTLKFVQYRVSRPRNVLIIDLWKVTTKPAARVLNDGCLSMTSWSAAGGKAKASGRELEPLFEHGLVLTLRPPTGAPIAEKPLTATPGVFRPDFSGYAVPGRWRGSLTVPGPAIGSRAMLEAWAASAKDGSLVCLVQTPVLLKP